MKVEHAPLNKFYLDAKNPRLGRHQTNADPSQEEILDLMRDWVLDELAGSYLENGFWQHEALLVIEKELDGKEWFVVVEGNRRLAALIYLKLVVNRIHRYKNSPDIQRAVERLVIDYKELLDRSPDLKTEPLSSESP